MALVLLAHPYFDQSIANKTIIAELSQHHPDIEVRHLHQLYPDYRIDVAAEQAALLRHDSIIVQLPMFWFNMPAILKLWFDEVFTYQFAYGSEGDKLKDKQVIISMTVGQTQANFTNGQENFLATFMRAIEQSFAYAQMQVAKELFLYDVSPVSGHSQDNIVARATAHSQQLIQELSELTACD